MEEDLLPDKDSKGSSDNPATTGSLGSAFGGQNELLQNQFTLNTQQQKYHEVVLLQVRVFIFLALKCSKMVCRSWIREGLQRV